MTRKTDTVAIMWQPSLLCLKTTSLVQRNKKSVFSIPVTRLLCSMCFCIFFMQYNFLYAQQEVIKLKSPTNGSKVVLPLKLEWHTAVNDNYIVFMYLDNKEIHKSPWIPKSDNLFYKVPANVLQTGKTYKWKVIRPSDQLGSALWEFTVITSDTTNDTLKLSTPVLTKPDNKALNQPVLVSLEWNKVNSAVKYRYSLAYDSLFSHDKIVSDTQTTATNSAPDSLQFQQKYFWRVKAYSAKDSSAWSDTFSFTTTPPPPPPALKAPVLEYPLDSSLSIPVTVTLRWKPSDSYSSYFLEVGLKPDSKITELLINQPNISGTSFTLNNLSPNTKYYWRVGVQSPDQKTLYSKIWSFRTNHDVTSLAGCKNKSFHCNAATLTCTPAVVSSPDKELCFMLYSAKPLVQGTLFLFNGDGHCIFKKPVTSMQTSNYSLSISIQQIIRNTQYSQMPAGSYLALLKGVDIHNQTITSQCLFGVKK